MGSDSTAWHRTRGAPQLLHHTPAEALGNVVHYCPHFLAPSGIMASDELGPSRVKCRGVCRGGQFGALHEMTTTTRGVPLRLAGSESFAYALLCLMSVLEIGGAG